MWQAATPVLAVATVTSGGKAPMIRRSKYDFPVPALPEIRCSYVGSSEGSPISEETHFQFLGSISFLFYSMCIIIAVPLNNIF